MPTRKSIFSINQCGDHNEENQILPHHFGCAAHIEHRLAAKHRAFCPVNFPAGETGQLGVC